MLLILIKNVRVSWVSRCIKIFLRVPTQSLGSLEQLITCVAQYSQKNPFKFHNYHQLSVRLINFLSVSYVFPSVLMWLSRLSDSCSRLLNVPFCERVFCLSSRNSVEPLAQCAPLSF